MLPPPDPETTRRRRALLADHGHAHRLPPSWSRVVGVGWVGLTLGLASVGASSQVIGRPVWWADDIRWGTVGVIVTVFVVFALCTGITVWAFLSGPFIPQVSAVGGLLLAASALADRDSSPGGAVVTGALAASALLLGFGSWSGRRQLGDADNRAASSASTAD
ncbi:MAG: hypothetical protein ACO39Y_04405 [Ilumatobacteraceae bacterium]